MMEHHRKPGVAGILREYLEMAIAGKLSGLALAAAVAAGVLAPSGNASAGDYYRHHYHGGYYNNGGAALAAGVAGVILGTALATPRYYVQPAPVYVEPAPVYVAPRRVYVEPAPVYVEPYDAYDDGYYGDEEAYVQPRRPYSEYRRTAPAVVQPRVAPRTVYDERPVGSVKRVAKLDVGSAEWISACQAKYKSFDRRTGTFLGHDGQRRMCTVQ
jgi:BA14K-like protein